MKMTIPMMAALLAFACAAAAPNTLTEAEKADGWQLLEQAAKKRGFLVSRGEYDLERMANTLLGEYHDGKLGRLSLEIPDDGTVGTGE